MSDPDEKERFSRRRKQNYYAKILRDPGEHKGAFALRVINSKKQEYKREKLNPRNVQVEDE